MTKRKGMFFAGVLVVSVLCGSLFAQYPAGSPVARHGALKVVGNKIVGEHGSPVALRGMSFFWNTPSWGGEKYYTSGVVNTLADDWKADIVRVAVDPNNTNAENWKTVVAAAKAKGIYVIIDFHAHDKGLASAAKTFFENVVDNANYKNQPHIIYEIFNEPCPSERTEQNGGGGCKGDAWADVKSYAETVVGAIRNKGDSSVIIVGTPNFSKRVDQAAANPVVAGGGKNLAYALHFYTGHVSTPEDPNGASSEHRQRLRAWAQTALNNKAAIFVSEFGVSQPGGGTANGENNSIDTEEALRWFAFLDTNQIGWANWSVNDKAEAASALAGGASPSGGWNDGNLSASGKFISGRLKYYATRVTLSATAAGSGSVSVSPPSPYNTWQQVTVTASAQSGSRFEGWTGDVSGRVDTIATSITLTKSSTSVQAVFFPDNLVKNSTFTGGIGNWLKYSSTGTDPGISAVNGEFVVTMPPADKIGTEPHEVRVQTTGLSLTNGRRYRLTFDAKATQAGRTMQVAYRLSGGTPTYHKINIGDPVSLTTTMSPYTLEFNMSEPTTTAGVIAFYLGGQSAGVTLDNVSLVESGQSTSVLPGTVSVRRASWSVVRTGGALQLRGPIEAGARVSLYDVRGKVVRSMAAADGMSLGAGVPAGSYFVVVRNRAGVEVLRTRVVTAR